MKYPVVICFGFLWLLTTIGSCEKESDPENISNSIILEIPARLVAAEDSKLNLNISMTSPAQGRFELPFTVQSRSALADQDFMINGTSLVWEEGDVRKTIEINMIPDDENELDELFIINYSIPDDVESITKESQIRITDVDKSEFLQAADYTTAQSFDGMELVWSDEFDGDQINSENWGYDLGGNGWGNNEKQVYTDQPENASVENGVLTITARNDNGFTSARLLSQGKQSFTFGRIDVRAKLPEGQGIWPAIWMLGDKIQQTPWPACGEIDIMELIGSQPSVTHGTAHWGNVGEPSQFATKAFPGKAKFSEHYHVFSVLWDFNRITWYVDEIKYHEVNTSMTSGYVYPFNEPFFFLLNVAVGGNWPGNPDDTTVFPQSMFVDYVRVFQLQQ